MSEALFALVLALAWFGAVNLALSGAASGAAWLIERGAVRLSERRAPVVLLLLKLTPGAAALFFTFVVFLPGHVRFEPEGVEESAGYTLIGLGLLGAVTLLLAVRRGMRDAGGTRRLERGWRRAASGERAASAWRLPVYELPGGAAVVSLAGLLRPRIFMTRPVIDALSADEMDVSLAHEVAHHEAHDNLKRLLMACSPDLLGLWTAGRAVERRWRAAAEFAADARATRGQAARAVALASALIKVARLSPAPAPTAAASPFYDGTLLAARVSRLLAPAADAAPSPARPPAWRAALGGLAACTAVLAADAAWAGVHVVTEGLIRFLP